MFKSVQTLLTSIVDYAGLFPPAKLGMKQAMECYIQHRMSSQNWMLDRFVLPASRLEEFKALLPIFSKNQWALSIILSADVDNAISQLQSLDISKVSVTALEISPLPPSQIEQVMHKLPAGIEAFFEIPLSENVESYLEVLQSTGAAAKVRTGGIATDAFPTASQLSQFIEACAKAKIPFKATAGLHHPLPATYPMTYEPSSPSALMHGFLNVVIFAALVYTQKVLPEEAAHILKENSIDHFQFAEEGISWNNHDLNLTEIEMVRQQFFRSFGSCSFQEPIDDLQHLQLL